MDCLHPARPNSVSRAVSYASPDVAPAAPAVPSAPVMAEGVWSTGLAAVALFGIVVMLVLLSGCEAGSSVGGPMTTLFPNADLALRKTPEEFAADAAKRQPFKADTPRGGEAPVRASVDYAADTLQLVNLSDEDWDDVEVWVNRFYVVNVSRLDKSTAGVRTVRFEMLFDGSGNSFPTDNLDPRDQVRTVEIVRGGKVYDVRLGLAD